MATSNDHWIKQRLPRLTDVAGLFNKNGITPTLTVDLAVTAALADNSDNKFLALADLLEMLASDYKTFAERAGDGGWSEELLTSRAAYWRSVGESDGDRSQWKSVPAISVPNPACDEYTRPL